MQQSQEEEESQQIIEDYNKVVVIDNPRETVTMKKIRELLAQDEPDWDRIKDDQNHFLFMLGLQNLFQLWLLLLLYYLNIGTQIAEFMVFPIDFCLMSMYIMTLVIIQFKEHDWILPPFNFLLCFSHFFTRTLLAIHVIFKFKWLHLEIITIMLFCDVVLVYLCFLVDSQKKEQCFLFKDYWWRVLYYYKKGQLLFSCWKKYQQIKFTTFMNGLKYFAGFQDSS